MTSRIASATPLTRQRARVFFGEAIKVVGRSSQCPDGRCRVRRASPSQNSLDSTAAAPPNERIYFKKRCTRSPRLSSDCSARGERGGRGGRGREVRAAAAAARAGGRMPRRRGRRHREQLPADEHRLVRRRRRARRAARDPARRGARCGAIERQIITTRLRREYMGSSRSSAPRCAARCDRATNHGTIVT